MLAPPPATLFDQHPPPAAQRQVVAAPRALATSSRLLYDALARLYTGPSFNMVGDKTFRDLVIARVVEPTHLSDMDRVLAQMGHASVSLATANARLLAPTRRPTGT